MIDYNIIATGSKGNAVVIDQKILIDCGVSFKALSKVYRALKLVLLTHIHSDHFQPTTLRLLAENRPTLRFAHVWIRHLQRQARYGQAQCSELRLESLAPIREAVLLHRYEQFERHHGSEL